MTIDIAATFAAIKANRETLDVLDDELMRAIRYVETALVELRPGVPTDVAYSVNEGEEHWLSFQKHSGKWRLMHAYTEDGPQSPLNGSTREVRAQVFEATAEGPTPLELLILEIADSILHYAKERGPAVERARALSAAIHALGYAEPSPGGT